MPTYEYACKDCSQSLEIVQSFTDDALTECPSCGGRLRKVFGNVGIAFKGTGFYKNDSRQATKSSSSTTSTTNTAAASDTPKSEAPAKSSDTAASTSSSNSSSDSTKPAAAPK